MYTSTLSAYTPPCQKRESDHIDGCEPPCGHWDLNSGLLEEQKSVLFTTEPSLQPPISKRK